MNQYFDVPTDVVELFDALDPPIRSRKLSNHEVLQSVCFALRSGVPWRALPLQKCTIWAVYKRYKSWIKSGLFKQVWNAILTKYASQRLSQDPKWFKELFIDTTMTKNIAGVDGTGKNPTDRGRLATKQSIIVDYAQIPVSSCFFPANRNDVTTVLESVDNISCNIRKDKRYVNKLVGDKGYVSKELTRSLCTRNIRLLTPHKRNSKDKSKMSVSDRNSLRRRHVVENTFCRLDKFKKIHCRHERLLCCYEGLMMLAMTLITSKKLAEITVSKNRTLSKIQTKTRSAA